MSGEYSNELRNAKPVDFLVSQAILLFTQGGAGEEEGMRKKRWKLWVRCVALLWSV